MITRFSTWQEIHKTGVCPETFSPSLVEAWKDACALRTSYDIDRLPGYWESTFSKLKQDSLRLYAYMNRCVGLVMNQSSEEGIAVALFNQNGIILKCYGETDVLSKLEDEGICRLSDWRIDHIGPNAVNLGLKNDTPMVTCGAENFARPLLNKAVYFSPCRLEPQDGSAPHVLGGIAIIVPAEKANQCYLLLANSMAYDINLHFFMADTIEQSLENDERGILKVDENTKTGKKYVMYCDRNLFRILGTPACDIYFKSLTELIDPLPANKQFWNIMDTRKRVNNQLIDLTVKGRTESFRITTDPYYQPLLNIRGMQVYVSSMKYLAARIAKAVGNNALFTFRNLIGSTSSFQVSVRQAKQYAEGDKNILIIGEFGSGRSVFAQAMHNASPRRDGPFVAVNCASLPRDQLVRQLFGFEDKVRHDILNIGFFELANNGTLFIGEIETLPLEFQMSLLNAIERGSIVREGGNLEIPVDVRIISSASPELNTAVKENRFSRELYYQLNESTLFLPPLRARRQDISVLADYFIRRLCKKSNIETKHLSPEAKRLLQSFPWTGNVRELQNTIESLTMLTEGQYIESEDIYQYVNDPKLLDDIAIYKTFKRAKITKVELQRTLLSCRNNKSLAAQKLGISRRSLYRYLEKYALQSMDDKSPEA